MLYGAAGKRPKYWWDLGQDIDSALGGLLGTHVRASDGLYTDPITGLITTVGNNIPRFESVGGLKAILIEPVATNLCTHSHEFRAAISGWLNQNCTVTDDADDAPDGNTTADKIVEANDVGQVHDIQDNFLVGDFTDDKSVTFSTYVKKAERDWVKLSLRNKANAWVGAYFDLTNGVVGVEGVDSYAITPAANGFYRCSITHDIENGVTDPHFNIAVASADNTDTYNGDGSSGIYIWGAQVEEFPVPTSYIVTSGATATRATESGYPLWTLPAGLFNAQGIASIWVRLGYSESDMLNNAAGGILTARDGYGSVLYNETPGGIARFASTDAANAVVRNYDWAANTWYKLVVKWSSTTLKYQVAYDSGAGVVWGAEVNFDGSYGLGINLRLAFDLYGPMWLRALMLDDEVWSDTRIDAWGSP